MPSKQEGPDREAEHLRQSLAPLFEPDQREPAPATSSPSAVEPTPVTSRTPTRTPRAWLLAVPALTLMIGLAVGFALGSMRAGGEPTTAPATSPAATRPAPAPPTSVVVQLAATSACLETARRGDQLVHLYATNQRDKVAELLVAYSVASRQCRRDASP